MTNFYAYYNRHDPRETQAFYEAETERKRQKKAKIDNFFTENIAFGNHIVFQTLALTDTAIILKDDVGNDYWVCAWDTEHGFRLKFMARCTTLEHAKEYFFTLHEEAF